MIVSEKELRHSLQTIAETYEHSERQAVEPTWDEETQQEMSEDTTILRLKIEREVAEYLAKKYNLVPTSCAAQSKMREDIAA